MSSCGKPASKRQWISLKNIYRHLSALGTVGPTSFDDEIASFRIGDTVEYQSRQVPIRSNISALMGAVNRGFSWCASDILISLFGCVW